MMPATQEEQAVVVECIEAPQDAETMLQACAVKVRHSAAVLTARVRASERILELARMGLDVERPVRARDSFPPSDRSPRGR